MKLSEVYFLMSILSALLMVIYEILLISEPYGWDRKLSPQEEFILNMLAIAWAVFMSLTIVLLMQGR